MLWEVYPRFLDCGYTSSLFWESSLDEIIDLIESHNRIQEVKIKDEENKIKTNIILNQVLAKQISEFIVLSFPGVDAKPTPLSIYFPDLFKEEKDTENDDEVKKQLAINKAKMEEFAFWHNQKRKEAKK